MDMVVNNSSRAAVSRTQDHWAIAAAAATQWRQGKSASAQAAKAAQKPEGETAVQALAAEQQHLQDNAAKRPRESLPPLLASVSGSPLAAEDAPALPSLPSTAVSAAEPRVSIAGAATPNVLNRTEKKIVKQLEQTDTVVRLHEQTHAALAGKYATGSPQFDYYVGPDNKPYAVGGHVGVDTKPIPNDPVATLEKADTIKRAALGVSRPSAGDFKVAAEAEALRENAQADLDKKRKTAAEDKSGAKRQSGSSGDVSLAADSAPGQELARTYKLPDSQPQTGGLVNVSA